MEKADQKKADKAAEKTGETATGDGSKNDPNLEVEEKYDEPNYKEIAPDGELNLYKVSDIVF